MNWIRRTAGRGRRMGVVLALVAGIGASITGGAAAHAAPAGAAVGAAPAAGPDVHVLDSKRFMVTNLSGYRIQLNAASGSWEGSPAEGSWALPGEAQSFELKWVPLGTSHAYVRYYKYSDDGQLLGDYVVELDLGRTKSASSVCRSWNGACTAGGTSIVLTDPANTMVTLGGDRAQSQADALDRLCRDMLEVSCQFDVKDESKTMIPYHLVGTPFANRTLDPMSKQIRVSETIERSQSVEVSATVEASVAKIVTASVTAKYGQVWTNSRTFEESGEATIRAGYKVWSEITEPVIRFTGDFTLHVGSTTFRLVGVHFDQADPKPSRDRAATIETLTAPLQSSDRDLPSVSNMPPVIVSRRNA